MKLQLLFAVVIMIAVDALHINKPPLSLKDAATTNFIGGPVFAGLVGIFYSAGKASAAGLPMCFLCLCVCCHIIAGCVRGSAIWIPACSSGFGLWEAENNLCWLHPGVKVTYFLFSFCKHEKYFFVFCFSPLINFHFSRWRAGYNTKWPKRALEPHQALETEPFLIGRATP